MTEDQYHFLANGPDDIDVRGGEATTVVGRLMLDLVGEVRHSLRSYNVPIPCRYDLDSFSIQRATGKIDTLDGTIALLTRRPFGEATRAAIAVVAETATRAEKAAIARWVDQDLTSDSHPQPWNLWTSTSGEDRDLASLRSRLPFLTDDKPDVALDKPLVREAQVDLSISAEHAPEMTPAARKKYEQRLLDAFRAGRNNSPEAVQMTVAESGLTWDTAEWSEVWTADFNESTREAYEALRNIHGDTIIVTEKKIGR